MLSRSIPQYNLMRKSILDLASIRINKILQRYSENELSNCSQPFSVLDIGCSDGLQIADFLSKYNHGHYIGIDVSEPMLDKARIRFDKEIQNGRVSILNMDLRNEFPREYFDIITSTLNGYSQEQIDRKKLSLEGVLVPCTNKWNVELLHQAGFRQVDVFWRWMNFVGYIAIK